MYDLYSSVFDAIQHKKKYPHYLEVVLFEDGHIEYAVPSHQEKLISICCEKLHLTRQQLFDSCPPDYFFDVIVWLCNISGCISIWTDFIMKSDCNPITNAQQKTLEYLSQIGIYEGKW